MQEQVADSHDGKPWDLHCIAFVYLTFPSETVFRVSKWSGLDQWIFELYEPIW